MNATEEIPTLVDGTGRPINALAKAKVQTGDVVMLAVEKGLDADSIAKLVEMMERREKAEQERAYTDALRAVQHECGIIIKRQKNTHTKSVYANLESINAIVTPVYTKHGISFSFAEDDCPLSGWKRTYCDVRHVAGHSVRHHVDLPLDGTGSQGGKSSMNAVQAAISTGTYAQRVLLCRVLNLTIAATDFDGGPGAEGISDAQLAELHKTIDEYQEKTGRQIDMERFLAAFGGEGCTNTDEFTVAQFNEATADLKRRIAQAQKGGQ